MKIFKLMAGCKSKSRFLETQIQIKVFQNLDLILKKFNLQIHVHCNLFYFATLCFLCTLQCMCVMQCFALLLHSSGCCAVWKFCASFVHCATFKLQDSRFGVQIL
jgi:hypothetical protein